jgi:hypothetical protein
MIGIPCPYKIDLVTYLFLKRIVRRKTKVSHEWYQSTALSLLSRRWHFLFVFKGTPSFKSIKPVTADKYM